MADIELRRRTSSSPDALSDIEKVPIDQNGPGNPPIEQSVDATVSGSSTWKPDSLEWRYTVPVGIAFIIMAIASEVISHHHGFAIPITEGELSSVRQFFKSFGPSTVFGLLFGLLFAPVYNASKLIQPYVNMKHNTENGTKGARSESVLVGYLGAGSVSAFLEGFKKRHWTIAILSLIAISNNLFSSLASSYFQIASVPHRTDVDVTVAGKVGNNTYNLPSIYTPFVSAAGSVDTVLRGGAVPSPYLLNTTVGWWMVPGFTLAQPSPSVQGGNLSTDLSAVMVQAKCAPASSTIVVNTSVINGATVYVISATLPNGCSATTYTPVGVTTWFGWVIPAPFECVKGINPNETIPALENAEKFYHPVAFSFFKNTSVYSIVFCYSSLLEYNVTATLSPNAPNHGVFKVTNRTAPTSLGYGPNGLLFSGSNGNQRIVGVGDSIRLTLADAIVKYSGYRGVPGTEIDPSLQDQVLSDPKLATEKAQPAFLLYQALAVQSAYVVGPTFPNRATYETPAFRLTANKRVSHVLTALCVVTGITLIVLFRHYHRQYGGLQLYAKPAGFEVFAALLSKSEFQRDAKLHPSDDIGTIREKLKDYMFYWTPDGGIEGVKGTRPA